MTPSNSRRLLGLALAATVAAALWPAPDDTAEANPPPRAAATVERQPRAASAPLATTALLMLPDRTAYSRARVERDPFGVPAAPPPPPVSAPTELAPPPPAPLVPPWQYGGRLIVPGRPDAVLLNDGSRTHALAAGETLDGWRLEADRGTFIEFIHLPSGQRIPLPVPQ